MKKLIASPLLATLLFALSFPSSAALVSYTITGDILVGGEVAYNDYGLFAGDTISVSGLFDDTELTGGTGKIDFDLLNGNTMTISAGALTLYTDNDLDGYAYLTFDNYQLTEFDYYAHAGVNGAPSGFRSAWLAFDDLGRLEGEWRSEVSLSAVPLPAALWLFVAGLMGLVGCAGKLTGKRDC